MENSFKDYFFKDYEPNKVQMNLTLNEIKSLAEYVGFVINMEESLKLIPNWEKQKDSLSEGVAIRQKEGRQAIVCESDDGKFILRCFTCVVAAEGPVIDDVEPLAPIEQINSGVSNA